MVVRCKISQMYISGVTVLCFLSGISFNFRTISAMHVLDSEGENNAVAGRFVSIPARDYINAFKASIKLGQCPLVMQDGSIKTCKDEFEGEVVFLAKAESTVDVSRVQSSEDILLHVMGGVGVSIGVLGLVSVTPKVKVAVTTNTNKKALNLVSSYVISKGVMTLHNPRPKFVESEKALFLSEIEIGGNEMLLVTLEFESEEKKVEVEVSVTFKILFISITAKLQYVHKTFKSKASCRIQFKSSWRKDLEEYFTELDKCIPRVKYLEDLYMQGPQEIREMDPNDEKSHLHYYFSSWKNSPYGAQFNLALINHDLDFLTERNTEIKAVIERINKLKDQNLPKEVNKEMLQLNTTLTDITERISTGLKDYHILNEEERDKLRDIYGQNKAPMYYDRYLERIISQNTNS